MKLLGQVQVAKQRRKEGQLTQSSVDLTLCLGCLKEDTPMIRGDALLCSSSVRLESVLGERSYLASVKRGLLESKKLRAEGKGNRHGSHYRAPAEARKRVHLHSSV
jgi:hypothetical protein